MALNGEGEPQPTPVQAATQAATIALFEQWQTYRNGVHMDWDTFRSINFEAIAVAVLTSAGYEVTGDEITEMPKLRKLLAQPSPFAKADAVTPQDITDELDGKSAPRRPYGLSPEAIAEHGRQVNG